VRRYRVKNGKEKNENGIKFWSDITPIIFPGIFQKSE
jgi:hypothetical protein